MASHKQVVHRWAQDNGNPIKGFNMFFERRARGDEGYIQTIFSYGYHFPLAAFMTAPNGERVVLANLSESRSISTSKHQSIVRWAIPDRYKVFDVPNVDPMYTNGGFENFHTDNVKSLLERAAESHGKSKRARKEWNKSFHAETASKLADEARAYAILWRVWSDEAPLVSLDTLAADLAERAKEQAALYAKERAERVERERKRVADLRIEQEPDFLDWRAGRTHHVPSAWYEDENGSVYVRRFVASGTNELQTSKGAVAPWRHAVRVFQFVKLCRERGEAWRSNGRVIRVGHFTIDSIDERGNMLAGCHYFAWERMAELAVSEGVFDAEPSSEVVEVR